MRVAPLLVLASLAGCSLTLDLEGPPQQVAPGDRGPVLDATPADRAVIDAGPTDAAPTVDSAPHDAAPDPPDMRPPSCAPGEILDTCAICDAEGRPAIRDVDPECPPVACPARYALFDGYCLQHRFRPQRAECQMAGACPERPASCGPSDDELLAVASACERIEGCADGEPPVLVAEDEGTACNQGGTCDADGECSVPEECFFFGEMVEICSTRRDGMGRAVCTALIQHGEGAERSCTAVCSDLGAECVGALRPVESSCESAEEISCDLLQSAQICQCRVLQGF